MKKTTIALLASILAFPATAEPLCNDLGFAGLLANCNRGEEIELTLGSGKPLGEDVVLESGAYYEMIITSDGSAELALTGPDFFRAIWMDEIVINDIEVRPMAVDSFCTALIARGELGPESTARSTLLRSFSHKVVTRFDSF